MRYIVRILFAALIINVFTFWPALSYADWNHNNSHSHDSGHHDNGHHDSGHGRSSIGVNFSLWPDAYYYGAPYYAPDYNVIVSPPVYQPVLINGVTYYLNDGNYYAYNGYGYQPVAPPVTIVQPPEPVIQQTEASEQPPTVIHQAQPASDTMDSITINIPNDKGGYTAVTLKKSGNGFIGPQGEFYPEFPKVSQLKVIYGK